MTGGWRRECEVEGSTRFRRKGVKGVPRVEGSGSEAKRVVVRREKGFSEGGSRREDQALELEEMRWDGMRGRELSTSDARGNRQM